MQTSISEGNFYEAEQMCRTLHCRYAQKGDGAKAIEVLVIGIETMLGQHQEDCATDLALLLVQYFTGPPLVHCDAANVAVLERVSDAYARPCQGQISFLKAAIKWSCSSEEGTQLVAVLHSRAAEVYIGMKQLGLAHRHLARSGQPEKMAAWLCSLARAATPAEADLFICRAVLQYCCLLKPLDGRTALDAFVRDYAGRMSDSALVHLCDMLLVLLTDETARSHPRERAQLFPLLRTQYDRALQRDGSFSQYLDKIGDLYFGIKPPRGALAEMMDMFSLMSEMQ